MALTDKLTTIANAIRSKTGKSDALTLDQMATEIESISAGGSTEEWIGDGNTHIWITLGEGRTSPILGCCPNGTVTVDWGDGTTPDTLTGTSTSTVVWTPTHEYAATGDYIITLTATGTMGLAGDPETNGSTYILRHTSTGTVSDAAYISAIRRVEIGKNVVLTNDKVFNNCRSLTSVYIPSSVQDTGDYIFSRCYSLKSVVLPSNLPSIRPYAFHHCSSLTTVDIPNSVKVISESAFYCCSALTSVNIPYGVRSIESNAFINCYALTSVDIPSSVMNIGYRAFYGCDSLLSVRIPSGVTSIGNLAFVGCNSLVFCDFTNHTTVPTLSSAETFSGIPADCEIRVPAALYDQWIAAEYWSSLTSNIVAV